MPKPDLYIYKVQPTRPAMLPDGPTPEEERAISAHFEYLKHLTNRGAVLLAGRTLDTDESGFGIVIFTAESEEKAHRLMEADPAVKAGVFSAELHPYGLALVGGAIKEWIG
jgi:uncharacterized protein YciI